MNGELLTWLLLSALGLLTCLPLWLSRKERTRDWFEPIYAASAYFLLIFVLRTAYALTVGTEFLGEPPLDGDILGPLNIALTYLIPSYLLFLWAYRGRLGILLSSLTLRLPATWSSSAVGFGWPFLLLIGFASLAAQIQVVGGLETYLSDKQAALTAPGQSYFAQGAYLISYCFLLLFSNYANSGNGRIVTFAVVGPLVLVNGFLTGSKGLFLVPALGMIIIFHYMRHRISLRLLMGFGAFVVVLSPVFNAYRSLQASESIIDAVRSMFLERGIGGVTDALSILAWQFMSRFHDIDALTYIIRDTPGVMDFQYGATLLPLLSAWIPRLLWEDKPIVSFGKIFGETYFRDFYFGTGTAASPTILGEAYINFHVLGMFAVAVCAGVMLRWAYEALVRRDLSLPSIFIYANLFLLLFSFWESNIAGFIADTTFRVIVLLLLALVFGRASMAASSIQQLGLR